MHRIFPARHKITEAICAYAESSVSSRFRLHSDVRGDVQPQTRQHDIHGLTVHDRIPAQKLLRFQGKKPQKYRVHIFLYQEGVLHPTLGTTFH
ncbi:Nucleoid occlusion protein [Anopheles sinensis]|uniref:Nucleoid occlusion protein n=1 Tax=Anopheles sinensis TaxID=74873 RepID=A0A084WH60_ANOSI|nr:Nucleoid occlusion protein [Anopheles sinensis]